MLLNNQELQQIAVVTKLGISSLQATQYPTDANPLCTSFTLLQACKSVSDPFAFALLCMISTSFFFRYKQEMTIAKATS